MEHGTMMGTDYRSAEPFNLGVFGEEVSFDPAKTRWVGTFGTNGVKIQTSKLASRIAGDILAGDHAAFDMDGPETETPGSLRLKVVGTQSVLVVRRQANGTKIIIAQEGTDATRAYRVGAGRFHLLNKEGDKDQYKIDEWRLEGTNFETEVDLHGTEGHAGTVLLPGDIVLFNLGRHKTECVPVWLPIVVEPGFSKNPVAGGFVPQSDGYFLCPVTQKAAPPIISPPIVPPAVLGSGRLYDENPTISISIDPSVFVDYLAGLNFGDGDHNVEILPEEELSLPLPDDLDAKTTLPFVTQRRVGPFDTIFGGTTLADLASMCEPIELRAGTSYVLDKNDKRSVSFENGVTSLAIEYAGKHFRLVFYPDSNKMFLLGEENEFKGVYEAVEVVIGAHKIDASRFVLPVSFPFDCFSVLREGEKVTITSFVDGLKIAVDPKSFDQLSGADTIRESLVTPAQGVPAVMISQNGLKADRWGERVVAIGDIHGEFDGFRELLTREGVLQSRGGFTLVQMGDVIDRGPKSVEAFGFLRNLQSNVNSNQRVIRLWGNHEQLLLEGNRRYVNFPLDQAERILQELQEDITGREVLAAYVQGNNIYTHAELRLPLFQLLKNEINAERLILNIKKGVAINEVSLQDVADRINEIFRNAVAQSDYQHPIFGAPHARGGENYVGGIFWEDGSDPSQNEGIGLLGYRSIFAHTPPSSRQEAIQGTLGLTRINVDAGLFAGYGGNRAYLVVFPNGQLLKVEKKDGDYVETEMK
ncbi:hypothetical protein A2276_06910 [candidate division WOR-1 bacterium RIFOXYA12_FULL_43_27]|uniref:Calcineurin-like phosphoesterase domain-containing protein n=1 Tax=candidate division WOR-1 bacterium RIFOXYC2_FULL_46_14 TaxID=1802587 RepID=A0A1F4U5L6_UNCSA|nr:MAG: hypothetical protein A2276_06910 [candidate division WOR-1 bacterium RIFOXYA12_FULL_43_27]OGC20376.1 MAG: hypothetical protein A2292_04910 [candidate division WOR-1 bacterium RIFOXYB2_FULL_46_45]OGC31887.1 MAG: hypothetical protein A2232_06540 [candidate division WOR-1 bacterium RIFOXYA2_FULL_46_56]OGC40222.1 MAG: hypothetical protein A2438_02930 [candidate division WOR-1 bacterium RIFOXYC2_FULL_46_14]